jgi:hypothetical protein
VDSPAAFGHSDERKIFQQFLGPFGGPAFARRAREVETAYDSLVLSCQRKRGEWLACVRLRLGTFVALAGSSSALAAILESPEQARILETLHAELQPRLRLPVAPTTSVRVLRAALAELREAIGFFNQRWLTFMRNLDLQKLNLLRDGYNRFYVMEKECALGSARVARQGFRKLDPLRPDDFLAVLPLLPMP